MVLVWWCAVSVLVSGVLGRDRHCHEVRGWGWAWLSWGFISSQLMLSQVREFLSAEVGGAGVIVGWIKV